MKFRYLMKLSPLLIAIVAFVAPVQAGFMDLLTGGDQQSEESEQPTDPALQGKQDESATMESTAKQQGGLTDVLMQQLGVTQAQAEGGAGALFQVAKNRMKPDAFSQVSDSVPGMDSLLSAAPKQSDSMSDLSGGLSTLTGGNSAVGDAASLISTFQKLDLSKGMVAQFSTVVVDYVKQKSGPQLGNLLQAALSGS